jgi:hypothetical protein
MLFAPAGNVALATPHVDQGCSFRNLSVFQSSTANELRSLGIVASGRIGERTRVWDRSGSPAMAG